MNALSVPVPTLEYEATASGTAVLEQPVKVTVAGPTLGGLAQGSDQVKGALVVVRKVGPSAGEEHWDDAGKAWTSWSADPAVSTGVAIAPGTTGWSGQVVPASGKDSAGAAQFDEAAGGYPVYSFCAAFEALDGSSYGLSPTSATVAFTSLENAKRLVIGPATGEKATNATLAQVVLKDAAFVTIGEVLIRQSGSGATVTIQNSSGASIVLGTDGSITITPSGGDVIVNGTLKTLSGTVIPI